MAQTEIPIGGMEPHEIDARLGAIAAKLREVRSLVRQYEQRAEFLATIEDDKRAQRRAELLDELLYDETQLVLRADEMLDEILYRRELGIWPS